MIFTVQNDSMKKLIEKYAEMEDVISDGVQLIFKGNPIANDDTPMKLQITSEDTLEVCKVPGIFGKRKKREIGKIILFVWILSKRLALQN